MRFHAAVVAVNKIVELFNKWGTHDYIGESVSQQEHAIQAAMAAEEDSAPTEMIIGALLHDIGHLVALNNPELFVDLNGLGAAKHEDIGADYLYNLGFSELVCTGSRLHVSAKRYMLTTDPEYRKKVSPASIETFKLQGGEMNANEIKRFEAEPYFEQALRYRLWDDRAKNPNKEMVLLEHYKQMMLDVLNEQMSTVVADIQFKENGYVVFKNFFTLRQQEQLKIYTTDLENLPDDIGKWMKYYEEGSPGQLARIENFLDYIPRLNELINSQRIQAIVEYIIGESVVLFKEKINFKYPGGGAFKPHQDEPAFSMFPHGYHITVCVPRDPMTVENGCLEMVYNSHTDGLLPQNEDGTVDDSWAAKANWEALPLECGDLLMFDSYIAHRSHNNRSTSPRRVYFMTYNSATTGDDRKEYYRRKRASFPPPNERIEGKKYVYDPAFNLGNPITK